MSDPTTLSAADAAVAIRERRLGCEELTRACLDRIARLEPIVRAFVDLQPEAALRRARELDRTKPRGDQALHGIPVAVKEVFDVAGYRCAWGTSVHAGRIPERDAEAVARLKAAGVVILGTAVSTEYAIAAPGPTTNPHDKLRSPGGSSSGPAAAVAAHMVPLALGSQSIGSIIRPSVYCGVMGLKPTRGAISNRGAMPLAIELDQAGPIARAPEDLVLACRALFAQDPLDAGSRAVPVPDLSSPARQIVEIVGPLRERVQPASREALERALSACRKAGLPLRRVELPSEFDRIDDVVWTLICRGLAAHHGGDYDRAANLMSPRMRELVERGRAITDGQHRLAAELAAGFAAFLTGLLPPGSVAVQAAVDDVAPLRTDGTGSPLLQALWTAAGFPVLAMPCGTVGDLPVGVQLAAAPMQESTLLTVAATLLRHF